LPLPEKFLVPTMIKLSMLAPKLKPRSEITVSMPQLTSPSKVKSPGASAY
jgi:hypothetical protein